MKKLLKTKLCITQQKTKAIVNIVILEVYDKTLRTTVYHYRKPTPSERKEIILNYIIDNSRSDNYELFNAN